MFVYFAVGLGALVAINYIISAQSRIEALKLTAFLLCADLSGSVLLHMLTRLPAKAAWAAILDFGIFLLFIVNRSQFASYRVLKILIPFSYLLMIGLNVVTLASRGIAQPLCDYVKDAIFISLLSVGLWSGTKAMRNGVGDVYSVDRPHLHNRRRHTVVRK